MDKEAKTRKSEIEAEIRSHVAAEKKAYLWVEKAALDETISFEDFSKLVNEIMPNHYKDINEERAISGICGYPLCKNTLKQVKQKYHISLASNKVVDLTERKLFCSIHCFKSSLYVRKQIPLSPLWLRPKKFELKLFQGEDEGEILRDDIVQLDIQKIAKEDIDGTLDKDENEKKVHFQNSDDDEEEFDIDNISSRLSHTHVSDFPQSRSNKQDKIIENRSIKFIETTENPEIRNTNNSNKKSSLPSKTSKNPDVKTEIFEKLLDRLHEWFTNKTHTYLNGPKEYRKDIKDEISQRLYEKTMNFYSPNPFWVKEVEVTDKESKKEYMIPENSKASQVAIRRKIVKERIVASLKKLPVNFGDISNSNFFPIIDTFRLSRENIVLKIDEWIMMAIILLEIFSMERMKLRSIYDTDDVDMCIQSKCGVTKEELFELARSFIDVCTSDIPHPNPAVTIGNEDATVTTIGNGDVTVVTMDNECSERNSLMEELD